MGAPLVEGDTACPEASGGVKVEGVGPGSPAAKSGLRPGDVIRYAGKVPVRDMLDLYAASLERELTLGIYRNGEVILLPLRRRRGEDLGLEISPPKPLVCNNKCVFCFVDQMPPGLRRSLYVKDEDYRLSFLHGNYLTLTNIDAEAEARIVDMHLSPLYVSVHATDRNARDRLIGREAGEPVLETMDRLAASGIGFHTQIVIVPGYNDGGILDRTLSDLAGRHQYILSVSVVPVGLTCHRERLPAIREVGRELAMDAVKSVDLIRKKLREHTGRGIIYAGDELFLRAGLPIPEDPYYDDYPQLDNGVGLIRTLIESTRRMRVPQNIKGKRLIFVTGTLAARYIEDVSAELRRRGVSVDVAAVPNRLFGPSVTVSGLLAGEDVLGGLSGAGDADLIVLPPSITNADGLTLDGLSVDEMAAQAGIPVVVAEYDFKQTLKRISHAFKAA